MYSFWSYTGGIKNKNPNSPDPAPNQLKATTHQMEVVLCMGFLVFQDEVEGKHGITAEFRSKPFYFLRF